MNLYYPKFNELSKQKIRYSLMKNKMNMRKYQNF